MNIFLLPQQSTTYPGLYETILSDTGSVVYRYRITDGVFATLVKATIAAAAFPRAPGADDPDHAGGGDAAHLFARFIGDAGISTCLRQTSYFYRHKTKGYG